MVTLIIFSFQSFTLIIFIILLTLSTSNGDDHHKYNDCSSSLMSCGKFRNVGYPFWGVGRPRYCGHPALQLHCYPHDGKEYPLLKFGDDDEIYYHIYGINTSPTNMTIQLHEFSCPFHGFSKRFDDIFQFSETVVNISLFYECHGHYMANALNCSVPCLGKHNTAYYYLKKFEQNPPDNVCKQLQVPVFKQELDQLQPDYNNQANETLLKVLEEGFEVEYLNFSDCSKCQNSGGICGSNDTEFACFHRKSEKWKLILGLAIPGFLILIALNVGFWCYLKRKFYSPILQSSRLSVPMNSDLEIGSSFYGIPVLPYNELQEATNNFDESQELGDGGFGIVYYGKLKDKREVAVKRLYEKNYKQMEQFMNEIEILTRLRHPNLVTLYGCTSRNSRELLLVYEYIPNGTVADHLYGERKGSKTLSWDIRMRIAIGTARALSYLHASDIVHRDVKTNNILLDNNFSVKVADFGLSRLFPSDATHVSTVPQGTPGYLDPQYHKNYQVTNKSDVYSFGVVLVELISSLPAVDISRQEDEINLYDYAMNKIQHGILNELVDQRIGFESDFKVNRMVTLVAELAFRCLQQEKEHRPTMDEVLQALEEIGSTDYDALKAVDTTRSKSASKLTPTTVENHIEPPLGNAHPPPSPNSLMVAFVNFTLQFFVIFILILATLDTSNGSDDKYESCSTSISCGKLQNVGYPFWGLGRPQYCGHPALQLHCPHNTSDHYPVLKNGDVEYYYVRGISNISSRMTIQLQELSWTKNSCAFNLSNEFDKILTLTDNVNKIRLFYKCPKHYAPQNHSVTCWSEQAKVTAFYLAKPNNTVFQQCVFAMVPVIIEEQNLLNQGEKTLSDVLKKGYEVYYTYSSHCNTCQASGGICASSNDTEFTCFRKNHKSGRPKLTKGLVIPGAFFLLVAFNVGFCCCMKPKFQTSILGSRRLYTDPTSSNTESGSLFCGIPVFSRLCHQNLVKLYGCTSRHSQELLLVYEFIPKGTVADHLYGNRKGYGILSFAMRMKIATESASALAYLHASDVIHRDVKTNNILLDENLSVKVADFGLSRLFPIDATHVSTAPQGTPGYLDPNYNKCYQVTSKSDVYSFGVVLVELISSLPAVDTSRKEDEINLSDYAMIRIQHGTLNELVDQRLGFESDLKVQKMITLVAELAFRCLQHDKELRPSMAEVLEALKQIESMDYEPSMANDMDYSKETLKQTSMTWGNDINPHSKKSQHLPSPNSVIDNWTSRSTSNTSA